KTRLFVPQLRFQSLRDLERVISHRFDVEAEIKRQKVLEGIKAQPVGHQRGPLRFHIRVAGIFVQFYTLKRTLWLFNGLRRNRADLSTGCWLWPRPYQSKR